MSPPCWSSTTYFATGSSSETSPCRTAIDKSVVSKVLPSEARLNSESEVIGLPERSAVPKLKNSVRPSTRTATAAPPGPCSGITSSTSSATASRTCRSVSAQEAFAAQVTNAVMSTPSISRRIGLSRFTPPQPVPDEFDDNALQHSAFQRRRQVYATPRYY